MITFPTEYEKTIKEFILSYWQSRRWELEQAFLGLQIEPEIPQEEWLYGSALAEQLAEIARAAAGQIATSGDEERDRFAKGVVYEGVQDLCERLFAPPGLGSAYTIPPSFWETPLGAMCARAMLWVQGDELITLAEAAQILGVTVQAVSQMADDGRLTVYYDPDAANPQRGRRLVSRAAVERLRHER